VKRSSVTCPVCGYTTPAAKVRQQFDTRKGGSHDARLLAIGTISSNREKKYREPTEADRAIVELAKSRVTREAVRKLPATPDEPLPYLGSIFNIHLLGVTEWGQLFTPRQVLLLACFSRIVSERSQTIASDSIDAAVMTCMGLTIYKMADVHSSLARWINQGEKIGNTFGRQALGIIWDFAEANPFGDISGSWDRCIGYITEVIEHNTDIKIQGNVNQSSATTHPLPDDSASAFVTDPPYYDAVPFADLSDFLRL
jgi:putative DNA methylase